MSATFSSWRAFRDALDKYTISRAHFRAKGLAIIFWSLAILDAYHSRFPVSKYTKEAVVELWVPNVVYKVAFAYDLKKSMEAACHSQAYATL